MQQTPAEDILTLPPSYKLYKDSHIGVATFLGSPVIGGYLIAENFRRLGKPRSARNTWIIAIASTIAIFAAVYAIDMEHVPSYLIPLLYSTITRALVQKYQGADLRAHEAASGQFYSGWRAVAISLIGLVILVAIIIAILFWADSGASA